MSSELGTADRTDAEVFADLTAVVRTWTDGASRPAEHVPQHLGAYVEERLNEDAEDVWERDVVERPALPSAADIVVNGAIGIVVVREFGPTRPQALKGRLGGYTEQYEFLLFYVHELSPRDASRWRTTQERVLSGRTDVRDLEVVTRERPEARQSGTRSASQWRSPAVFIAAAWVVFLVALAVSPVATELEYAVAFAGLVWIVVVGAVALTD